MVGTEKGRDVITGTPRLGTMKMEKKNKKFTELL